MSITLPSTGRRGAGGETCAGYRLLVKQLRSSTISKKPFDIDTALKLIKEAVEPYPKAALFELAEAGFGSAFEQMVACMISIRTQDEVTLPLARQLFARARTPAEISRLTPDTIEKIIHPSSFSERKAYQIRAAAARIVTEYAGNLPCDRDVLLSFDGIGPKCANLVLGVACGESFISVDVHVDRVTNRWGYVQANSPEKTMLALEAKLPPRYWIDINRLLVPFGKHICTGRLPFCSSCPVEDMCQQVGVTRHR